LLLDLSQRLLQFLGRKEEESILLEERSAVRTPDLLDVSTRISR
jgi:hypothetical protein